MFASLEAGVHVAVHGILAGNQQWDLLAWAGSPNIIDFRRFMIPRVTECAEAEGGVFI